ncbi:hypothetical protein C4K39_3841 [Pseudomonas sessilinigenes]|nr:hypothetical protein C4K39_3841 [Pseudomonas sessilinigenes]
MNGAQRPVLAAGCTWQGCFFLDKPMPPRRPGRLNAGLPARHRPDR